MSSGNSTPLDLVPDPVYQSPVIQMIVNRLMKKGKKNRSLCIMLRGNEKY